MIAAGITANWKSYCRVISVILIVQIIGFVILPYFVSTESLTYVRRLQLIITFQCILLLGSMVIWHRCISSLAHYRSHSIVEDCCKAFLLFYLFLVHFSWLTHHILASDEPHYLAVLSFICFGCYIHLIVLSVVFIVLEFFGQRFFQRAFGGFFLKNDLHTLLTVIISLTLTLFCFYVTHLPPFVKRETITIDNLPRHLDGFTITLTADFHVGPTVGQTKLQTAVDIINDLHSDVVVISGDLVDGSDEKFSHAVEPLKNIRSRYGVYYATGNHEYYHAIVDNWFAKFRSLGINVLHNSNVKITPSQASDVTICIAGVDDITSRLSGQPGHGMNISAALNGCDRKNGPVIAIIHQPNAAKIVLDAHKVRQIDLILSGHTHGGQLYLIAPFAYLINAYYWGLYAHSSGAQVYVTSGTFYWGPPMKMYGLSEIVALTLRSSSI